MLQVFTPLKITNIEKLIKKIPKKRRFLENKEKIKIIRINITIMV